MFPKVLWGNWFLHVFLAHAFLSVPKGSLGELVLACVFGPCILKCSLRVLWENSDMCFWLMKPQKCSLSSYIFLAHAFLNVP